MRTSTGFARLSPTLSQSGIPFILGGGAASSIGNNGALSAMTGLPTTYSSAYVYFPANAIAAGVAAGWYYTVFSSTTAGTIYNNKYTSGIPTIPSSPTPFVTTGPGVFTQTTSTYITGPTVKVPAGAMGLNGSVEFWAAMQYTSTAGAKQIVTNLGATQFYYSQQTVNPSQTILSAIRNRGVANKQVNAGVIAGAGTGEFGVGQTYTLGTENTALAKDAFLSMFIAVATDYMVLEHHAIRLYPA